MRGSSPNPLRESDTSASRSIQPGVYIEFGSIPEWLLVADIWPLRWLAAGTRSVFLPAEFEQVVEPGGCYMLGRGAAILAAWVVVGFVLASRTLRAGRKTMT